MFVFTINFVSPEAEFKEFEPRLNPIYPGGEGGAYSFLSITQKVFELGIF